VRETLNVSAPGSRSRYEYGCHSVETRDNSSPFGIRQKRIRLTAKIHVLSQDSKTTISTRPECPSGLLRNLDVPGKSLSSSVVHRQSCAAVLTGVA
jgi:hypothetical protein